MRMISRSAMIAVAVLTALVACRHRSDANSLFDDGAGGASGATNGDAASQTPAFSASYERDRLVLRWQGAGGALSQLRELTLIAPLQGKIAVEDLAARRPVEIPAGEKLAFRFHVALVGGEQCRDSSPKGASLAGDSPVNCAVPLPFEFASFCERGGGRFLAADQKKKRAAVCECKGAGAKPKRFLEKDAAAFRDRPEAFDALCRG